MTSTNDQLDNFVPQFTQSIAYATGFIIDNNPDAVTDNLIMMGATDQVYLLDTEAHAILGSLYQTNYQAFLEAINVPFNHQAQNETVNHYKDLMAIQSTNGVGFSGGGIIDADEANYPALLDKLFGPPGANTATAPQPRPATTDNMLPHEFMGITLPAVSHRTGYAVLLAIALFLFTSFLINDTKTPTL